MIRFHTNLDRHQIDVMNLTHAWSKLPTNEIVPRKGERFRLGDEKHSYELEVHSVTYHPRNGLLSIEVELHTPSWFKGSIKEWEERFA